MYTKVHRVNFMEVKGTDSLENQRNDSVKKWIFNKCFESDIFCIGIWCQNNVSRAEIAINYHIDIFRCRRFFRRRQFCLFTLTLPQAPVPCLAKG